MSFQVCHCGWSKVTTHQGLRTHQGKMGCTPKGMRIPESQSFTFNSYRPFSFVAPPDKLPLDNIFNFSRNPVSQANTDSSDKSLQICHCGWSKVTSYQGLRIHQGMMGCTPKGMRIPESEQRIWKNHWEETHQNDSRPIHKSLFMSGPQTFTNQIYSAAPDTIVKDADKSFFETPERSHQTATNLDKVRRALDFSPGAQQVNQVRFAIPVTAQETAVPSLDKERDEKDEVKKLLKAQLSHMRADLQQKIQIREHKVDEIISSVKICEGSLDAEWLEIERVFSEVVNVVEDARQKAFHPLKERRQKVERESQALLQKLEGEIDALKKTINKLDENPDLQVCPQTGLDESTDWKNVTLDTSFSFGTLRTTTSAMIEEMKMKLEKLTSIELKRIPTFAVDVRLNPATAHQSLHISDDWKEVRDGQKTQRLPDAPGRFDMFGSILALSSLTTGKSYWEVDVSNKTGWDLGVARGNANRKGILSLNPDNGYWVTVHYEDKHYAALTAPPVSLDLKEKPQKVGVFVDYEEGLVSFYNVTSQSHIYSFTECLFSDEIFPYFSPHLKQNGKNSDPLIISTVTRQ
ncbi:E3 ubiquitin-protein ligase TRIM39-like [Anabas testudineus]|uniref:B30.2/SPRY domain-containing protein n=1 Tax=Anabas testudineus TaxID=64144 RepID=A0A7N6FFZ7_ANATE|nr:E3 ubiquitin-protein ligase TRIM39-like [Anabas testudineus]